MEGTLFVTSMQSHPSGRGGGRGRSSARDDKDSGASASRGRGRGVLFSSEYFEDASCDPSIPSTGPFRKIEDPTAINSDSDDDDDFIAHFRRLHPDSAKTKPSISSSSSGSPSSTLLPGRGRTRGASSGLLLTNSDLFERYPIDSGISSAGERRNSTTSSSSTLSPIPFPSSKSESSSSIQESSSDTEKSIVPTHGDRGEKTSICSNYIRLSILRNTGLFEYHVDFSPLIDSKRLRGMIINRSDAQIGRIYNFDGAKLYLPFKLPDSPMTFPVPHPAVTNEIVEITIRFIKQNSLEECTHFYNVLLRRIMQKLGLIEMQRNFYDYKNVFQVPEHRLEIWPGHVTAVNLYEDGLMLCCDSSFRVLRTDTMLFALKQMMHIEEQEGQSRFDHRKKFKEYALGKIVLTKYNNKHYRIDDVNWEQTPLSTFPQNIKGQLVQIPFVDYYRSNYSQHITDLNQPLLVTRGKVKRQLQAHDFSPPMNIMLVPELCFVTGMTEEITSDFRTMRVVAEKTRIPPIQRYNALETFIKSVNSQEEVRRIFEDWGLQLADGIVELNGRVIGPPKIIVGKDKFFEPLNGEFNKKLLKNEILEPIAISEWLVVCSMKDDSKAVRAIRSYAAVAPALGIRYQGEPQIVRVHRSTPAEFRNALINNIRPGVTQFVMAIIPSNRDELYNVIKLVCNKEIPVASQVIRGTTLTDEKKIRSVMQKVALQINCKLGGALWTIRIPLPERIMFLGMDVYHDPRRRNPSVTAVVASINQNYTKYYTRVIFQQAQQENISSLCPVMIEALQTFYEENRAFPDRVIMFRDGVGDGQLELTRQHEVTQMQSSFEQLDIKPLFTFCVVQKRINTRLFLKQGSYVANPEPGTVMDHTITRPYQYDFFLVSQLIREGTVNPTHYIVLHDNANMKPDVMQKFAYATSFMYFNWSGSIRVPAMCQYAHKAAGLVGQHLRSEPSRQLQDKLYYL